MTDFLHSVGIFVYGFGLGYFALPIWKLLTKIWEEAKIAKQEWRNPR